MTQIEFLTEWVHLAGKAQELQTQIDLLKGQYDVIRGYEAEIKAKYGLQRVDNMSILKGNSGQPFQLPDGTLVKVIKTHITAWLEDAFELKILKPIKVG